MAEYYGDFDEDATVLLDFNTFDSNDPSASVTITNLVDADIKVHKDGNATPIVTDGATIAIDFATVTGQHLITVDTSVDAAYSTGSDYNVRIEGTTVDGATINAWVGSFSIQNRHSAGALRPTTAGRTLDVSATGEAGADLVQMGGSVQSATDLKDFADAGYDPATNKVEGVKLVDTTTTNTDQRGTDLALLAASAPTNFGDLSISVSTGLVNITQGGADKAWLTTARILTANTNFNDPTVAAIADGVLDEALSGHVAAGSLGKAVADTETDAAAIRVKTDDLTFTKALELDTNIKSVNGTTVTGDGQLGTEWGPV